MSFIESISKDVDEEFGKIFDGLSGKAISKISIEQIDKKTDRMKAEATAYIGLKGEMCKELIKKLSEIEGQVPAASS